MAPAIGWVDEGRAGDVAQLGEHLLCKQGVVGSNPIVSTKLGQARERMAVKEERNSGSGGLGQRPAGSVASGRRELRGRMWSLSG